MEVISDEGVGPVGAWVGVGLKSGKWLVVSLLVKEVRRSGSFSL